MQCCMQHVPSRILPSALAQMDSITSVWRIYNDSPPRVLGRSNDNSRYRHWLDVKLEISLP
jgi:hypothetical protein